LSMLSGTNSSTGIPDLTAKFDLFCKQRAGGHTTLRRLKEGGSLRSTELVPVVPVLVSTVAAKHDLIRREVPKRAGGTPNRPPSSLLLK
jgi:hypothetical protein